ncbi:helix-turn-helix domain-containing protein [Nocardiopsis eucommiae]|uniref:Helix-turn-helix domain-containing protein n=1 Tax=Nocardiopsis eucommiae TaxID=2831970 RepID=A0A975QKS3_9ACTN|nr:helix-turn-helix domain-containing protein [Nocardiopsis eucommiae]
MAASPTLRRRRLARELLRLREEAGLTAKQAAAEAKKAAPDKSWFEAKITRIETRKLLRVKDADLQVLLDVYGVSDPDQREAYRKLAREAATSGWWYGYRDILGAGTYVDLESEASRIRTYQVQHLPGLLQTEAYARAMIRAGGVTSEEEVDRRVEVRMMRQHLLTRLDAPRLWAVIDETAFRKLPSDVAADQIRHLLMVQRPSLRVQVLPDLVGPHAGMDGSFVVLDFKSDPSAVYAEQVGGGGLLIEDTEQITIYETVLDHVQASALSVEDSRVWLEARLNQLD